MAGPAPVVVKPVAEQVLRTAVEGLGRREGARKRVIVLGGGLAGLVAAFELQREGHDPLVLEAQSRVGGRIYTLRSFAPGLYAEAGRMRMESDMQNAFLEVLREDLVAAYSNMQEIVGGMDRLPNAFYAALPDRVRFGAEVHALEQDERSVTVHYRTEGGRFSASGDYAVCTLPFGCLRQVEARFSHAKQKAIRELHYSASTKVLFQVRNRRWETEDGIAGGATCTDLPVRRLNYPTPDPATTRGVLLAGYTWGQDALRWGSLDEESRLEQALDDVERIHPWIREEFEVGASHAWYNDRFAGGAFALFDPGQQTRLQADVVAPEGRVLFAGEHCSLYHAWIQGALETGIRAAREIHEAAEG